MISRATYLISDITKWPEQLESKPGVYEIVALDRTGKPKAISRVGGVDGRGVLYIGRGKKLREERLNRLRKGLFAGKRGHIAGRTYLERHRIQAVAPKRDLAFRFEHCNDYKDRENQRLRRYIQKFGEVPPLNASQGG